MNTFMKTFRPGARVKISTNKKSTVDNLRGESPDTLFGVILQSLEGGRHLVCFYLESYCVQITKFENDLELV
jgi:hypothetical protein